jgi:hypothetical protein
MKRIAGQAPRHVALDAPASLPSENSSDGGLAHAEFGGQLPIICFACLVKIADLADLVCLENDV